MLAILCSFAISALNAQRITNLILVGDNGITEKINEAKYFIAIKQNPNGSFERLDYKLYGSLQKLRTYSDSLLKTLDGNYMEYAADGSISLSGVYKNNNKEKSWYHYNDTGKVILEEKYRDGKLVETINPDTVKKEKTEGIAPGEVKAEFDGGHAAWIRYLVRNLDGDVAQKSVEGGSVKVAFVVEVSGQLAEIYLRKSVEFVLDEEALRVIQHSPPWIPALQKNRKVKAYRIQPISFNKE
jgi:antitoxin component YwqK of YwqJK toxin-antitoxin module